ncbi:MAG: hypothetical protein IT288_06770 [Bdellovibrionales bacterium]|nr:hypothetical protein [Bdellovibrionales bacterium]
MKNTAKKLSPQTGDDSGALIGVAHNWNKRILVVDDEPGICESYADILAPKKNVLPLRSTRTLSRPPNEADPGYEFEVTICDSYDTAWEAFQKAQKDGRPFAMGFFDVMLGAEKDGYDLVKEMHNLNPDLYAVFVTAYNDRTIESINSHLGAKKVDRWDYLNKPFTQGEILQKARNFITLWNLEKEGELKTAQLAEAQARLMEGERMASVAAVARGVTHEFGNILMQIMGKADLCRKKEPQEMKAGLERILEASQRANEILEKFKNLSGTGEGHNQKDWVFPHHVLDEALDLLEHQLKTANVKVTIIKRDLVKVRANATSLLQVLVNLSINAVHAMGNSGQIDYAIVNDGKWVELRVRDYGPGIKRELLDKVLEPFFTTKGKKGTGLGLSISREIVEMEHRGQLKVVNHPVKGLEVIIRIPVDGEGQYG